MSQACSVPPANARGSPEENPRKRTVTTLLFKNKYKIEALIGGQISLDIQPIGNDKSQVVKHLKEKIILFFGDKCDKGGNDYALAQKADAFWQVNNWQETKRILNLLDEKKKDK